MTDLKLKPNIKRIWLHALRSGEYEQGRGVLHQSDDDGKHRYCCMGVLCELAVAAGVIEASVLSNATTEDTYQYRWPDGSGRGFMADVAFLPEPVAEWAFGETFSDTDSTHWDNPRVGNPDRGLSEWNDTLEADFTEIADLIEQDL